MGERFDLDKTIKKFFNWVRKYKDPDASIGDIRVLPKREFIDLKLYKECPYRVIGGKVLYYQPVRFRLREAVRC